MTSPKSASSVPWHAEKLTSRVTLTCWSNFQSVRASWRWWPSSANFRLPWARRLICSLKLRLVPISAIESNASCAPSMNPDESVYLQHMLDAIAKAESYLRGVDETAFKQNSLIQDGVIRQIEIIGEAARHLSDALRAKYAHVPWQDIAG